jgi:hypothetical protein
VQHGAINTTTSRDATLKAVTEESHAVTMQV